MTFVGLLKKKLSRYKKNKKYKKTKKLFFVFLKFIFLFFLCFGFFVLFLLIYYGRDLPRPEKFTEKPFIQSTKIYDRTGDIVLYDIYGEEKREIIPLDRVPESLKNAVLTAEDNRFYQHSGLDWRGIARAILIDLKLWERSQGASTITQQLIRSSFLTRTKTLNRKVKEVILALELEKKYSKDQILEWYLNEISLGENCYGVEAASQTYFKKTAADLSLSESATLAALISAPSYYSPYGSHKKELLARKDYILDRMQKLGFITQEQLKTALTEEIEFSNILQPIKAPHFVFYIKNYLINKYGEDFLKERGMKVYTTLDWDLQKHVEEVVEKKTLEYKNYNANNAAVVVLDPKTGEILSLVGSKNYFGESYPDGCDSRAGECLFDPYFDVATLGERQPGSAFKPFVYATAFKKGYTPSTLLWDVPTEFNPNCDPAGNEEKDEYGMDCYHPHDYDEKFRGKVSIRQALAQSLNLPSVKLLYLAGINESIETAEDLGITTLRDRSRYGLSLVLGGGEVNLLEMVSAYGVFAADGLRIPPVSVLKIEDWDGNIIEQNKKEPKRVLTNQVARLINDVLSDNEARVPVLSRNSALYFENYQVAAKTGTTSDFKDTWTIGYTPFVVIGVWAGNNNSTPVDKKTGLGLAAPIWRQIMEKILTSHSAENFIKPDPIMSEKPILRGEIPNDENHSILFYIDKNNPLGPVPADPTTDPQYNMWEKGIENWLQTQNNPSS